MCSKSVLCPLCTQTSFESIDALRVSLIKAANGPLSCPICLDLFLGLDKLTIHLFSHTNLMSNVTAATTATTIPPATAAAAPTTKTKQINTNSPATNESQARITKENAVVNTQQIAVLTKEKKVKKAKQVKNEKDTELMQKQHLQQQQQQQEIQQYTATPAQLAVCDICEFTFRNEQLRDMHFHLVHKNTTTTTACGELKQEITAATTTTTSNNSNEADFKCHLCAKTFKMKGSLRVHLKVVHLMGLPYVNNSPKLNICDRIRHKENKINVNAKTNTLPVLAAPTAETNTATINALQQKLHQQQQQQQHIALTSTPQLLTTASNGFSIGTLTLLPTSHPNNVNGSVLNINSKGEFVSSGDATNVLLVFNTAPAPVIAKPSAASVTIAAPVSPHSQGECDKDGNKALMDNPKIWECDVCAKSFTTKYFLKKHKRLHTGEMPYTCEICARTFTFQQSYHKHLLYHSDQKPHMCTVCGRAFKELSTLQNHVRIHSGEKPFKCEVCGKCFRQRVSFLVHTRIHTGVMPYKCEICEKSFRYKVSQRTHKCLPQLAALATESGENNDQISETFIKEFLENTTTQISESQNSPASVEITAITSSCSESLDSKAMLDEVLLSKTIDDIVVESCNKMGIGSNTSNMQQSNTQRCSTSNNLNNFIRSDYNDGSNSPSQKLQNMRLYSPQQDTELTDACNGFSRFLLDDVTDNFL